MKILFLTPIIFLSILSQSCEEDDQKLPCIEGTLLGPVCRYGAGYLGYAIQVNDSIFGAIEHSDSTPEQTFILAALNLPEVYRNQVGQTIYFTAREATEEEIGELKPQTANCVQPPLIVIENIQSTCQPNSSE